MTLLDGHRRRHFRIVLGPVLICCVCASWLAAATVDAEPDANDDSDSSSWSATAAIAAQKAISAIFRGPSWSFYGPIAAATTASDDAAAASAAASAVEGAQGEGQDTDAHADPSDEPAEEDEDEDEEEEAANSDADDIAAAASASASAAHQCRGLPEGMEAGKTYRWPFMTKDRTGQYLRHFTFHVPVNYTGTARTPSLFYFHGWGEGFPCQNCTFHRVADANGFITVMPEGMDDGEEGMLSWNVLSGGRNDVCTAEAEVTEYTSCTTLNELGRCNTYTCHDDVKFVSDLTEYLLTFLCMDEDRMYATGASNGAMFLYSLIPSLRDRNLKPNFQAILPAYGAVFENMENIQHVVPGTAIFAHHGLHDVEIPPNGGESQDHFLYVSIHRTLSKQAIANGCSLALEQVWTPWDGQSSLTACYAYKDCVTAPVWRCDYDYGHGFWTDFQVELMWWQLYWTMPDPTDRIIV